MTRDWLIEHRITRPDGITVRVTITAPVGVLWGESGDRSDGLKAVSEVSEQCAIAAASQIEEAKWECPF